MDFYFDERLTEKELERESGETILKTMQTTIAIKVLDLGTNGRHLIITAGIGDTYFPMLLDTGASNSVFDKGFIEEVCDGIEIKAEEHGTGLSDVKFETFSSVINGLKIGGLTIERINAVLMHLDHVNEFYEANKADKIGGILGSDILLHFQAEISYKNKTLTLYS